MKVPKLLLPLLDAVLGKSAGVRHCTALLFIALPTYLTSIGMIWYLVDLQELQRDAAWVLTAANILCFTVAFIWVRTGWSQKLRDPVMAFGHALSSLVLSGVTYVILDNNAALVLVLMAQAIVVAMLRLKPYEVLRLGVAGAAILLLAFAWEVTRSPIAGVAAKSAPQVIVGCSSLLLLSLVGKWVSDLRVVIASQAKELRGALATVQKLATQDQLTGLLNRRMMLEKLEEERQVSDRHGLHWCVALVDLDHFKQVNDRYGHAVGDAVLKGFADMSRAHLRVVDVVGRWGGEEFLVLFPRTCTDEALSSLERLRLAFNAWRLPNHPDLRMSFSAGLTQAIPDETLDQVVERADKTMYQAKQAGRGRVMWAPPVPPYEDSGEMSASRSQRT